MRKHIPLITALLCLVGFSAADGRTWTDRTGKHHIEAEFVEFKDGKAWLQRSDGRLIGVRPSLLSKPDQKYIREELRRRRAKKVEKPPEVPPEVAPEARDEPEVVSYGPPRELCKLASGAITESSGLACSRNAPGLFWTHNDSGDAARIYLFNTKGEDLGGCELAGVQPRDFEDMASFSVGGKNYLLLGDVGDNERRADVHVLYLVQEPPIHPQRGLVVQQAVVVGTVRYRYDDDRHNCESVAVDPVGKTILLVSKEGGAECGAYAIPWPKNIPNEPVVARKIATLKIPTTTAMDVSPNGRRAVVLSWAKAYEYTRGADEDWAAAFSRPPRTIPMPPRKQGESICYGADGKTLYLTSEKLPTPLWEVPVVKQD